MTRHIVIDLNNEEWAKWMEYFKRREYTPPMSPSKIAAMVKRDINNQIDYEVEQ